MNKIKKYFELEFIKEELKKSLKFKKNKIIREENLEEVYSIKGLEDYTLHVYPYLKFYSVEQYDRKNDTVNSVGMFTQQDVIGYLNIILKKEIHEAAFKLKDYILELHRCDDGWDYTLYDNNLEEIDGGVLDAPEYDLIQARDVLTEDFIEIKKIKKCIQILTEIDE